MPALKRIDRTILSNTDVGKGYTVSYLTGKLDRGHHEVTGSMTRLSGMGYFQIVPCEYPRVYIKIREGGEAR